MTFTIRKLFLAAFALVTLSVAALAEDPKSPLAKLDLKDGDSIVFLGDSITHQCLYTQYVEDFFYTRYPKMRLKFHNSGVGGAKAWDALQRFDRDVAAYKPKYVTVLLGMNDGRYTPYDEEIFQTYRTDMTEVVRRIVEIGATPVLMTPTMFDARAARLSQRQREPNSVELYNSVLAYYGTWLRDIAAREGHGFVDMYSPLNNITLAERKTDPKFTLIADAVHPGPNGQLVMAYAILEDMGLRGPLSNIRLVPDAKGKLVARATGGKVTDLTAADDRIAFTWTADALPFVVPQEAQLGTKLLKLGHRASREGLDVHGIAAGPWQLSIDGQVIGVYQADALARHIELQENPKTPQYQQALKVVELNKQRNAGPVHSLRDEWRVFQQYARAAEQLKQTPDNDELKKQVEGFKAKLEGMDERIKEHQAAALASEDEIFKHNQPQPRKYALERVELAAVSGVITLNGKPVEGATVTLISDEGHESRGVTNAAGKFITRTGLIPGAVPGQYKISIIQAGSGKTEKADAAIPEALGNSGTTWLRIKVNDKKNEFNFDLRSE